MCRLLLTAAVAVSSVILLFGCGTGRTQLAERHDGGTNFETRQPTVLPAGRMPEADNRSQDTATNSDEAVTNSIVRQYDAVAIATIEKRWDELLAPLSSYSSKGTVVLEFRMHADGTVTDLQVVRSRMNRRITSICKKAVLDSAPFAIWPDEMRREFTNDSRKVRFTFNFDNP
jgi:TonB family protein